MDIPDICRSSLIPFTLPQDAESGGNEDGGEDDSSCCSSTDAGPPPPQKKARIELSEDIQIQHHSKGVAAAAAKNTPPR